MHRTGRNQPCPCGSGQKYKNCCAEKDARGNSNGVKLVFAGLAIIAAIGVVASLRDDKREQRPAARVAGPTQNNPMNPGAPQPPGPVPAGKVWSTEHGHWHDAPRTITSPIQISQPGGAPVVPGPNAAPQPITINPQQPPPGQQPPPQQFTPGPQPPGPVPAGKVWSTEHGHWHDAAPPPPQPPPQQ